MTQCVGLYIAPLTLVWLLAAFIGTSQRMLALVAWGMLLTGLAYGCVLLAAMALAAKVIKA